MSENGSLPDVLISKVRDMLLMEASSSQSVQSSHIKIGPSAESIANDRPQSPVDETRLSQTTPDQSPVVESHAAPSPIARPGTLARMPQEVFQIVSQVGEGTFGKVYKARNTTSGLFVALKKIRMEGERDGFPVTAMREIKLLQSLEHINVIRLHEMMVSEGILSEKSPQCGTF